MLDPRSIALQGFGSAPRFVALQGLVPLSAQPPATLGPILSGPGRRNRPWPKKKPKHRDTDEEVLLFLLRL